MVEPTASVGIDVAASELELAAILELQRQNLASALSAEEARSQGFVTVVHTLPVLRAMHAYLPSIVARSDGVVVGYALSMTQAARPLVPALDPMFERLSGLPFRGRRLGDCRFYVMGQICISRHHRGRGVFDALYGGHRAHYAQRFACVVTEVATRNTRSMRAHERVGFNHLHQYRSQSEEWAILAWDFL